MEGGYSRIQSTKPQTLGSGLSDSPVGLASWILEKFYKWSDLKDNNIESVYTKDELLTNICIYWFTNTINSSIHYYLERLRKPFTGIFIPVPTGYIQFKHEIARPPKSWLERGCNLVHFSEYDFGGHFAALETPKILVNDLVKFFGPLRNIPSKL